MLKKDLRIWALWDPVISRIEFCGESYNECQRLKSLFENSSIGYRRSLEVIRFDVNPFYCDERSDNKTTLKQAISKQTRKEV